MAFPLTVLFPWRHGRPAETGMQRLPQKRRQLHLVGEVPSLLLPGMVAVSTVRLQLSMSARLRPLVTMLTQLNLLLQVKGTLCTILPVTPSLTLRLLLS